MPSSSPYPAPPLRDTAAAAALPARVRRLLGQVHAKVAEELGWELERVLDGLQEELIRDAETAANSTLQTYYFNQLRQLREHRERLVPAFLAGLEDALVVMRAPRAGDAPAEPTGFQELRLVDDSEVSEAAVVAQIGGRQEHRAGLPLLLLGQRFGVLAGAPAFEPAQLPVGPHALAALLATSARVLEIDSAARLQLYRIFDRQLMPKYPALAESVNELLDGNGVLPGLAFIPLRPRPASDASSAQAQPSATAPAEGGGPGAGGPPAAVGAAAAPGVAAVDELAELAQLQQLLTERRQLLERLAGTSVDRQRVALATGEVDAGLGELQLAAQAGSAIGHTPAEIRQDLLARKRAQHGQAAALSREDSEAFELLDMLYAELHRAIRPDAPSADLLERLQVPLLRAALRDRGLFVRRQHPARQLLNAVAEAGAGGEAEAGPQLQQLREAVDHVVDHYDGDPDAFAAANNGLQDHLREVARRAESSERRQVEAARGREKLALAKQTAAQAVHSALAHREPPRFLKTLLDQAWVDVLTLVLLRNGEQSSQWREHVDATHAIIAASIDGVPAPDGLQAFVEEALGLVGYQGGEAAEIATRLAATPDRGEDPASRTELAMKIKARTRLGADATAKAPPRPPRDPREQDSYNHLRSLPFGTWIEFGAASDPGAYRCRLSWYSPTTGHVLMVNRRGQRVDVAGGGDLDQIARLLAAGGARIVPAGTPGLLDRAWQATLATLRSLAGRPASADGEFA